MDCSFGRGKPIAGFQVSLAGKKKVRLHAKYGAHTQKKEYGVWPSRGRDWKRPNDSTDCNQKERPSSSSKRQISLQSGRLKRDVAFIELPIEKFVTEMRYFISAGRKMPRPHDMCTLFSLRNFPLIFLKQSFVGRSSGVRTTFVSKKTRKSYSIYCTYNLDS